MNNEHFSVFLPLICYIILLVILYIFKDEIKNKLDE